MNVLFEDANLRLEHHPLDKVLLCIRKPNREATAEDVLASMRSSLTVDTRALGPLAFVMDVRAIVGRNDSDFERASTELRRIVSARSTRFVVLVATQVGALQSRRLASQDSQPILVATTEEEAFRMARGEAG